MWANMWTNSPVRLKKHHLVSCWAFNRKEWSVRVQSVRNAPCIPVLMRKRSNRADAKMNADLQRWLIESGEAEELVAFLREERAPHPAPPPRVAVTTSLDVDIFDAMMARASSEGITSRSGALRAAVREWVRDVECKPESHED